MGLIVGLHSGTHSRLAVVGGILTIAIADSFSDAAGIHISEESENKHTTKQIWVSTLSTFLSKFVFTLTFIIPIILFDLSTAIKAGIIWGFSVLSILSYYIAKSQDVKPWKVIAEHLLIALTVIIATHFAGNWISTFFKKGPL